MLRLFVCLVLAAPAFSQEAGNRIRSVGRVMALDGAAWAGAHVVVYSGTPLGVRELGAADLVVARSDERGRFRVGLLPGRSYDAFAHGGASSHRVTRLQRRIGAGEMFRMFEDDRRATRPRLVVHGLETWKGRRPQVRILDATGRRHDVSPSANGVVVLPPVPGTGYRVELFADDRRVGAWNRAPHGHAPPIHVPPPVTVAFRVIDRATQAPVRGARVTFGAHDRLLPPRPAFEPPRGVFAAATPSAKTDAQGRAALVVAWSRKASSKPLDFLVEASGYARTLAGWNDTTREWPKLAALEGASETPRLEVALDPGVAVYGRVRGARGAGRAVVGELWFREAARASIARAFVRTRTDDRGRYRVTGIGGAWSRLRLSLVLPIGDGDEGPPMSPLVDLYRGDLRKGAKDVEANLDLSAARTRELQFVLPDGRPAMGADVVVVHSNSRGSREHPLYHGIRCNRRGRCRIRVQSDKPRLAAYAPRHYLETRLPADLGGEPMRLIASARATGRVRDSAGKPVAGLWVAIASQRAFPGSIFLPTRAAHNELAMMGATDQEGRFELYFVPGRSEYAVAATRVDAELKAVRSKRTEFFKGSVSDLEIELPKR